MRTGATAGASTPHAFGARFQNTTGAASSDGLVNPITSNGTNVMPATVRYLTIGGSVAGAEPTTGIVGRLIVWFTPTGFENLSVSASSSDPYRGALRGMLGGTTAPRAPSLLPRRYMFHLYNFVSRALPSMLSRVVVDDDQNISNSNGKINEFKKRRFIEKRFTVQFLPQQSRR